MIVFEQPVWLLLLLLIIPCFLMALRSIGGLSRAKTVVTFTIRSLVILLLTMALANPSWEKRGEGVTVTVLLDRSQSVPYRLKKESLEFIKAASEVLDNREREDQVAVVTVAKDATINAMPDRYSVVTAAQEPSNLAATNLAEGLNIALAIMPDDTANRVLLASDGNETEGVVLEVAELAAANGVPVDVLVLKYEHENEVIFERLVAPPRVRQGQAANIKMVLRSQTETTGTVYLKMNGAPLDLTGDEPGTGRRVELAPGPFVLPVTISMDQTGPQEFEGLLEVDGEGDVPDNNRAVAVTFVGAEGRILIIHDSRSETEHLVRALRQSDIGVDLTTPDAMLGGLVYFSGYDAIVLANLPRWVFDEEQDRMLHAYVHDLGGGLIMLGGPNSFGAGGWIDSEVSRVLPVELDPPSIQQMPRGALALIMHSCEMPQGNFWG
ncbi:MAG: VWA domain-containing protein, partial [Planctomycetota bacterium]